MTDDLRRIRLVVRKARRRWLTHTLLRAAARGLMGFAGVAMGAWLVLRFGDLRGPQALLNLAAITVSSLVVVAAWAVWPLRRRPSDAQVARFVEERCPQLEDRLATAVEYSSRQSPSDSPLLAALMYRDAADRASALDLDQAVSRRALARRSGVVAGLMVACVGILLLVWTDAGRVGSVVSAGLWPSQIRLQVEPGDARVVSGGAFQVRVRVGKRNTSAVPTITVRSGNRSTQHDMKASNGAEGTFVYTVPRVADDFRYSVSLQSSQSTEFKVTVLGPARVTRIDVHYQYPVGLGMAPRVEQDGGDVYGPSGTRVQLRVFTDKPIRDGALAVSGGTTLKMHGQGERVLAGGLTIVEDGSYRVSLTDREGLTSPGDTEYFIRVLANAPPDVRIIEPGTDRQVTPLEEVPITARAEDDHGVKGFDLVYAVAGGPERSLPFSTRGAPQALDGSRVLYLEDLKVRPGDFVTYYARAADGAGGKATNQARSDIFFLQVTPFDEEFVPPQTQAAAAGAGAAGRSLEDLVRAQKQIVVATWNLDRRGRRSGAPGSEDDVRTVARAQADVKKRAMEAAAQSSAVAARPGAPGTPDAHEAMANAIEAMGRAEEALNAVKTAAALPHETRALQELMKAQATDRRRQLMRASAGGGTDAGANQDLSTLFDRELRRQQKTNYETPRSAAGQQRSQNDALDRLRQLAERQGELTERQRNLERDRSQMDGEEFRRQLERLTREQSDLRQQVEQLAQQMQNSAANRSAASSAAGGGRGGQRPQDRQGRGSAGGQVRAAAEAMRQATARLRDGNPGEANRQAEQALRELRSAEQQVRSREGTGAQAIGDLEMQARQAADAQRDVARKAAALGSGDGKESLNAARRLAGEKERLADQVDRLQQGMSGAASNPSLDSRQRQALEGLSRDLDRQQVARRMRDAAAAMGEPAAGGERAKRAAAETDVARTLDRLADRLAAASGNRNAQRASDRLGQARDIQERLAQLERQIREGERHEAAAARSGQKPAGDRQSGTPVGTKGGGGGADAASLARLREEYRRELQRGAELLNEMRRADAGLGFTPEGQQQILSAPGYHQDFGKWSELARDIAGSLENAETTLASRLREEQSRGRLQAPLAGRAPESYRRLVDEYYLSLAGKPRK